jgi:zinc protease
VEVLSADFATGLGLLTDVLRHPTFPDTEIVREREVQIAGIRSQRDNLLKSAGLALRRRMFGARGYGLDVLGSEESVARLGRSDLQAFHRRLLASNNCVLAIYGDVKAGAVRAAVGKVFHGWEPGDKKPLSQSMADHQSPIARNPARVEEQRDKKQAVVVIGFPGTTLHSPDRFALELLQEACSDLGSRLFLRVREKLGLAYYVGAQNFVGLAPGYFAFYAGTEPTKVAEVEKELLEEARLLAAEGLTGTELQRAKAKLIGQKKIGRQDLGTLAMTTALDELYGLGYANIDTEDAHYEAVSPEEIRTVARRYLCADSVVVSVVNPDKAHPGER